MSLQKNSTSASNKTNKITIISINKPTKEESNEKIKELSKFLSQCGVFPVPK